MISLSSIPLMTLNIVFDASFELSDKLTPKDFEIILSLFIQILILFVPEMENMERAILSSFLNLLWYDHNLGSWRCYHK